MTTSGIPADAEKARARRVAEMVEEHGWDPERISVHHPVFLPPELDGDAPEHDDSQI
jgi:hypothetical protein